MGRGVVRLFGVRMVGGRFLANLAKGLMRNENIWLKWETYYETAGINPDQLRKDGIIALDEKDFCGIMFIMRDPNNLYGDSGEFKDLRELYRERLYGNIGKTLATWTYGILNNFPPYSEVKDVKSEILHNYLKKVAVLNLKKTDGKKSADLAVINAYASHDRELLLDQIRGIKPKLIIACGVNKSSFWTFDSLIWLLDIPINPDNPRKAPIKSRTITTWVVPLRHPSNDRACENTYGELKSYIKSIPEDLNLS